MTSSPVSIVRVKHMISEFEKQSVGVNGKPPILRKSKSSSNLSTFPGTIILPSSPVCINVKSMIFKYENLISLDDKPSRLRRVNSVGNLSTYSGTNNNSSIMQSSELIYSDKNIELVKVEQQMRHLKKMLNEYKTYRKENHIDYQNQIFIVFANLVNVGTKNNSKIIDKKSQLMEETKRLNKILNSRLPSEAMKGKDHTHFPATRVTKHVKELSEESKVPPKIERREEKPQIEHHKETKIESNKEEDAPVPSVKNLKKAFERKSSIDDVPDRNTSKITRKYMTFNGRSDSKYVPYSERFKSGKRMVEPKDNSEIIARKSELTEETKIQNKILNSRLPSEVMQMKDNGNFSATNQHVKEEVKVPHKTEKHEEMREVEYHKDIKIDSKLEEDALVPHPVKNLKKLFEKDSSRIDVPDRNTTKITRKCMPYTGTSDAKYVPYSEKSKETDLSIENKIQARNGLYEKSSNIESSTAAAVSSDAAPPPPPPPPPLPAQLCNPVTPITIRKQSPKQPTKSTTAQGDKLQDELKNVLSKKKYNY